GLVRRADGAEEWIEADWVVGGDGAGSFVRRILGDNFVGTEYEEKFLLADVTLRWPLSDRHGHLFLRAGGPIVAFPYPYPGRWRLIDTSNEAESGEPGPTVERFRRLFGEFVPEMIVEEVGWTSLFRIHRRLVERYRIGRVLLMGDAAHIHSPASGQGLNTGVQDAINLAWKLALVATGRAPATLLDSYEPERRPVAEGVLDDSHRITEMVLVRNPVMEHVRDAILRVALGLGPVQQRLAEGVSKIGTSYRDGPIVAEAGGRLGGAPRAGDRMPDPELAPGRRLSDELSGGLRHHLLAIGPDRAAAAFAARTELVARGLGDLVTVREVTATGEGRADALPDPNDAIVGALAMPPGETQLVLVRPDLYLAFRGRAGREGPEALARELGALTDRIFARRDPVASVERAPITVDAVA
ncbi:MAG: FAD-dependent monooxygenase, partial [Methylobacteriaceae bacterium]|nr:FAD-dependent monooxygenase [Methylobacteriaceae bacterium]